MFSFLKKKQISQEIKEFRKAKRLLNKLWSLHLIRALLILFVLIALAPIVLFILYKPQVQKDLNYGVTFSNKYARDLGLNWKEVYISLLDDLGTKNLRLVAYWDDIEIERDTYDYSDIKWQLDEAEKRNVNVMLSVGRKVPRYPECFEPVWWKEMDSYQFKEVELLEYLKTTIQEFKGYKSIKIWQVENEPFFKFGDCIPEIDKETVAKEVALVKTLDSRPILIQDSGEGGFWFPAYQLGDYLGISMYRKVWYDFWHVFFGNFIYFQYPLAHWTYKIKADLTLVPYENIYVTELQAEPWGPGINSSLTTEEKDKTMSRHHFLDTISYAQKAGFKNYYFWGVEWWYWEKYTNQNPFYWDTIKALFSERQNTR